MITIAVISFPGNNCEVESMRSIKQAGMKPLYFRWNDDTTRLKDVDGYFLPGGFSYEDRGRAGMVAGRDPIFDFLKQEAAKGKPIIGNCNGAQVLVESGLIPNATGLQMSLARNVSGGKATGFLAEWIFITPTCQQDRCCTSDWEGVMHIPIAHGEGRFTTKNKALWDELLENNQVVFSYCDPEGNPSESEVFTPNGSEMSAAGICNQEGNVVALMPHPERTPNGIAYFESLKRWIESHPPKEAHLPISQSTNQPVDLARRKPKDVELFIDTIITNNEERTVEQAAKRFADTITIKQLKYLSVPKGKEGDVLSNLTRFNPNKEIAYLRRGTSFTKWDADAKQEVAVDPVLKAGTTLLRRDNPDTGSLGKGSESGVCYVCSGVSPEELSSSLLLEVFGNPHASSIELL